MSRNDLTHWIAYWLNCSAEQTAIINQRLREMTMTELKEIDRRAADRTQSASVLAELLSPQLISH
jgi:hypothetical protein